MVPRDGRAEVHAGNDAETRTLPWLATGLSGLRVSGAEGRGGGGGNVFCSLPFQRNQGTRWCRATVQHRLPDVCTDRRPEGFALRNVRFARLRAAANPIAGSAPQLFSTTRGIQASLSLELGKSSVPSPIEEGLLWLPRWLPRVATSESFKENHLPNQNTNLHLPRD